MAKRKQLVAAYVIRELDTGYRYAGSTTDLVTRIGNHISKLKSGQHSNPTMQSLYDNGFTDWSVEYVEHETIAAAKAEEMRHLQNIGTDASIMNVAISPDGGCGQGYRYSEETKRKMSEAGKGRVVTDACRAAISAANTGRVVSSETRNKLSLAHTGRIIPDSVKAKMSTSSATARPVTIDGVIYSSKEEASKALGLPYYTVKYRVASQSSKWNDWRLA